MVATGCEKKLDVQQWQIKKGRTRWFVNGVLFLVILKKRLSFGRFGVFWGVFGRFWWKYMDLFDVSPAAGS